MKEASMLVKIGLENNTYKSYPKKVSVVREQKRRKISADFACFLIFLLKWRQSIKEAESMKRKEGITDNLREQIADEVNATEPSPILVYILAQRTIDV